MPKCQLPKCQLQTVNPQLPECQRFNITMSIGSSQMLPADVTALPWTFSVDM